MGKHRRELLVNVGDVYRKEREEFYQKYRYFQLHKWEILKLIKQEMLAQKVTDVQRSRMLAQWVLRERVHFIISRVFQVFDHERFMIVHRVKMMTIALRIRLKFRKRVLAYGKTYEQREQKHIKYSTAAMFAGCLRNTLRERAKKTLLNFMQMKADQSYVDAKFKCAHSKLVFCQRIIKLKLKLKKVTPEAWQKSVSTEQIDTMWAAKRSLGLIQCIFMSSVFRRKAVIAAQEEYIKEQYKVLDAIRA